MASADKAKFGAAAGVCLLLAWGVLIVLTTRSGALWLAAIQIAGATVAGVLALANWKLKGVFDGEHRRTDQEVRSDPDPGTNTGIAAGDTGARADEVPKPAVQVATRRAEARRSQAVENAGIVIGEVEAFRCWWVVGRYLASMRGTIWLPDSPMRGEGVDVGNSCGVHAFKSLEDARSYAGLRHTCAVGRVRLWGVIVEHETGYRAEYGRPAEILELIGPDVSEDRKRDLIEHYGLGVRV